MTYWCGARQVRLLAAPMSSIAGLGVGLSGLTWVGLGLGLGLGSGSGLGLGLGLGLGFGLSGLTAMSRCATKVYGWSAWKRPCRLCRMPGSCRCHRLVMSSSRLGLTWAGLGPALG